jgi:hypothetical protein
METLARYLLALLLTVVIEGGIAWLFGLRTARLQLAVAMINCMTNPALNFLLLALAWKGMSVPFPMIVFLEVVVVVVEWQLLVYATGHPRGRLFSLSLAANTASFFAGWLIFWR